MVTMHHDTPGRGGHTAATLTRWGNHRGQLPTSRCQPLPAGARAPLGQAGGLIRLSGRIPAGGDTQSIILSPGQRPSPADLGKAGCSCPAPRPPRLVTPHRKTPAWTTNHIRATPGLPAPAAWHDRLPGSRVKDA